MHSIEAEHLHALRGCPDCGLFSFLPEAQSGTSVHCTRCNKALRRIRCHSHDYLLSCVTAGLIFCVLLATAPFINVSLYGRFQVSTLLTGPETLERQHLIPLAVVVILTTLALPFIKLVLMNIVLLATRKESPHTFIAHLFRWTKKVSSWAMLEVYLLGFLVAYTRLKAMTYVEIDTAVYALICAIVFTAMADSGIDSEEIWRRIRKGRSEHKLHSSDGELMGCHVCFQASHKHHGAECPRCGAALHPRKKNSIERSWALMIAAFIFYIPANYYPVMNITQLGKTTSHTIMGGLLELLHAGFWPLALLVFVASIVIPFFKLVSLLYMLVTTHFHTGNNLRPRMRLYRVISFIGRWSMVDIFMVSIMVALVQFGQIARITSDTGAICFAAVVIFTILAVESFDTRLMWDRARGLNDNNPGSSL